MKLKGNTLQHSNDAKKWYITSNGVKKTYIVLNDVCFHFLPTAQMRM